MNWDQGYVVDAPYTYGYYLEMGPAQANYALLMAGHAALPPGPCCELGFGQGVSICVHAAADSTRRWWGNDFNPEHVRFARSLAADAGLDATLSDESFAEFCARDDLPEFSYVALHGVWSWISPADRTVIVDFLRRKLKVGGVVYLSYNTAPGWAAMAPVRQLFAEYARSACAPAQGAVARMKDAVAFVEKLLATNPPYLRVNPIVGKRMEQLRANPVEYLPHEYLGADWHLTTFSDVSRALSAAKLSYVGPANLIDRVDVLHLTDEQRAFLAEIPDPVLRETTRDVLIHQQFRRDLWVKGASRLSARAQREALDRGALVLAMPPSQAPRKVVGARGSSALHAAVYDPLLALVHAADAPMTYADIEAAMASRHKLGSSQLAQALALLVGLGVLHPVQPEAQVQASAGSARRLNERLLAVAEMQARAGVLASPLTGGGVSLSHVAQLFVLGRLRGLDSARALAEFAWGALQPQGVRLSAGGKVLETPGENLDEITRLAREHEPVHEAILRRLQIA